MPHELRHTRIFQYDARDESGALVSGTIAAKDRGDAGRRLGAQGIFVVRLSQSAERLNARAKPRASHAQIACQIWQLATLIEGGLSLNESLDCLARQATKPALRALLTDVSNHVQEGGVLSEAMQRHPKAFPSSLIALVRASETSGTLAETLRQSADYLDKDLQTVRKIRAAMLYPVFTLAICLGVTIFLLVYVLPQFAMIFADRGAILPLPTRMLLWISGALINYWAYWTGGALLATGAVVAWARSANGRRQLDRLVVTLPVMSTVFNALHQSRAFRGVAMMIESQVPLIDALQIIHDVVPNTAYRELWSDMEEQARIGERFAAPLFASSFIEESVAQMIDKGDKAGKVGLAFKRVADFMESKYERTIGAMSQALEPTMILLMGGIVGFIALSMMLPLFQAASVVSGR